jgi:peptide/nickel transport system substrate-binding protein
MRCASFNRARRRWRSLPSGAALCLFIVVSPALSGCSSPPPRASESSTLRLGIRDAANAQRVIARFLFAERLIGIDWHGRPQGSLATGWKWDDEGRTLEVQLREQVTFHDGTRLNARVVADILKRIKADDPRGSFDGVSQFQAAGEHTLLVRLTRPDAFLVEAIADTFIIDPKKPDIGTGPFKLLTRTASLTTAESYRAYYQGTPGIDRVEVVTYDTPRAAWVALMRGQVDMVQQVNRDSAEFLEGAAHVEMSSTILPFYIPFVFNVRHPILKRVEVRRALAEAVNREEIVREAMGGHGRVADDPVWPFHWAYNAAARKYTYNPNAARVRLDAAGFPMRTSSARGGMASRFSVRCVFWKDPQFERIALLLQRQLGDVGINLILEGIDDETLQVRVATGEFDTYLYQLTSGKSFDWTYRFWHSGVEGAAAYQDSGYRGVDAVLDRLRVVRPDAEVRAAVADLRERFYQDVPAAFLAWPETTRAINAGFDVGDRSDPDFFANMWKWRRAERQSASK